MCFVPLRPYKAPQTPVDLQTFRSSPTSARLEWNLKNGGVSPEHFVVYYTAGSELAPLNQWNRALTKGEFTFTELVNLDPKLTYAAKVSAVDVDGRESLPSTTVYISNAGLGDQKQRPSPSISRSRTSLGTPRLGLLKYPDYFAVRNLKCAAQTSSSIGLEWIGPVEFKDLIEYEITLNGRKEFLTEYGVLKAVHLGERQIRQAHQPATRFPSWYKTTLDRQTPDQLLQFLQVTDLEPYSRYEFVVRPLYQLRSSLGGTGSGGVGVDQTEGVSVTVICHTDWKRPQVVEAPELEAIHPPLDSQASSGTLLELRIQRITEQNGPLHEYFVLVAPYSCATDSNIDFEQPPDQFSFATLSNNLRKPVTEAAPYLAIRGSPIDLFKPNHNTAIVILGSEQPQRVSRTAGEPSLEFSDSHTINGTVRGKRSATFIDSFEPSENQEIRVANRPIDLSCTYRVALSACSKYPNGRLLCTYSPWSEPIHPKAEDSMTGTNNGVQTATAKSGRIRNASKFTILIIGLTCGLVFFALLSIILACVLRYRKRHLTERHILGSATQWDAQFCGDLMKSMHADEAATSLAFHGGSKRKGVKPFRKRIPPSALFYSFSSSGLHSPSNSSMGLQMMRPMYPSAGGLAAVVPGRSITSQSLRSAESPAGTDLLVTNFATADLPVHSSTEIPKSPDCGLRTGVIHCDHVNSIMECTAVQPGVIGAPVGTDGPDRRTEMGPTMPMPTSSSFSTDSNTRKHEAYSKRSFLRVHLIHNELFIRILVENRKEVYRYQLAFDRRILSNVLVDQNG
ncbi:unnamed protein product [Echinostoma caproni]|uniref:Fibronectin type-III domain-containing protein n=1 Tax=Echinostoma caproni TaxID=27848 RepID=A0A183A805_9TREM|nr:unnamed protein product [Echinostoma caproni]